MFYDFSLAVPANTAKTSPVEVQAELAPGIIHRVEIEFPPGCAGLAHVVALERSHQAWPTNPDGSFASDAHIIAWDEHHPLSEPPYTLTLRGWNLDDTYQHTIPVRLGLLPAPLLEAPLRSASLLERLLKRMGF